MQENTATTRQLENPELLTRIQADITQSLAEWVDAVNNGTADSVSALYTAKAILLATFEPRVLTTAPERLKYFMAFKARNHLRVTVDESYINVLGENAAEASGLYTFTFDDDDSKHQAIKARFIFVFTRQSEGDWLIAAHHSSLAPQ